MPTRALTKTPFELWESKIPDVNHIHVFGCTAYALIPEIKRKKLDAKATNLIFIGYEPGSKAYRLLDRSTKKIVVSRNIQFINKDKGHVYNNEGEVTLNSPEISPNNLPKIKDKDFNSHNKNESNIKPNTTVVDVNIKQDYQDVIKPPEEKMELRRSNRINLGK